MTEPTPSAIEGRMLAHRRILSRLIASLPEQDRTQLLDWISNREVMRDGQEDPGAVPAEGSALELAMADEFSRVAILAGDTLSDQDR
ncbi:hypothetical protein [Paracoccus sp. R86501]|uniref:hypothetical protein n=1 Tax=Paracoccus sp. R86501 TaxID=3101711 RepID=UPI00366D9427